MLFLSHLCHYRSKSQLHHSSLLLLLLLSRFSRVRLFATLYSPWNSPGRNSGVDSLSLLQGIFPTQGSNAGLPHHRQILYQLNHQGSPVDKVKIAQSCLTLCGPVDYTVHGILQARILEWVAFLFSRESSQPRDRTQVSCIAG